MSSEWNLTDIKDTLRGAQTAIGAAVALNAQALRQMQLAWELLDQVDRYYPVVDRLKDINVAKRRAAAISDVVLQAMGALIGEDGCSQFAIAAQGKIEDAQEMIKRVDPTESMPKLQTAMAFLSQAHDSVGTGIEPTLVAPVGLEAVTVALGAAAADIQEVLDVLGK